jgi:hypothetical protein
MTRKPTDPNLPAGEAAPARTAARLQALLALSQRARQANESVQLQFMLVNETFSLSPYTIAILWAEGQGIVSVSGVSTLDRNSAFNLWLSELCERFAQGNLGTKRITADMLSTQDQQEWSQALPASALWVAASARLSGERPARFGLLLARDQPWKEDDSALLTEWVQIWAPHWERCYSQTFESRLSANVRAARKRLPGKATATGFIADVIRGAGRAAKNPSLLFTGLASSFRLRDIWADKRRRTAWIAIVVCFFPVKLTVLAPAELVPANPAVIRVPIEGVVDEFFVSPNQKVSEGQPLFKLDLTSLTSRLQIAQQEIQIAATELRQSTLQSLSDPKSRRTIAPLEGKAAERRLEAEYLKELLSKAQIRSPRAGVALFDDPSEWIGRPVVAGEKVMVVASEGEVEIEAWIALSDAIDLPQGTPVTLYLNATPLSPVNGELRYVGHEAIQRPDGNYAYRLRASLDPKEKGRRVGLKGTARVSGQFVPLAYWVLRKPIAWLRQFIGI